MSAIVPAAKPISRRVPAELVNHRTERQTRVGHTTGDDYLSTLIRASAMSRPPK
jgi:hypothetical protein